MKILSIEASAITAAVAALEANDSGSASPQAITVLDEPRALARSLVTTIDKTLSDAGWTLDQVDALAIGIGPGSWTSLRIALSTAKTLAQARGWRLAGIPTFDAIAAAVWRVAQSGDGLPEEFLLLVAGKSRPGEVYGKIYAVTDDYLGLVQPEWVGSPQMMADTLGIEAMARSLDTPLVIAGDAAESVGAVLDAQKEAYLRVELPIETVALEIGRAAQVAFENGEEADPLQLQPLYVAPSAAERNLAR
jgi:tRNA threonylcarbamoyladenosine biosynthesis protein TsaB